MTTGAELTTTSARASLMSKVLSSNSLALVGFLVLCRHTENRGPRSMCLILIFRPLVLILRMGIVLSSWGEGAPAEPGKPLSNGRQPGAWQTPVERAKARAAAGRRNVAGRSDTVHTDGSHILGQ